MTILVLVGMVGAELRSAVWGRPAAGEAGEVMRRQAQAYAEAHRWTLADVQVADSLNITSDEAAIAACLTAEQNFLTQHQAAVATPAVIGRGVDCSSCSFPILVGQLIVDQPVMKCGELQYICLLHLHCRLDDQQAEFGDF